MCTNYLGQMINRHMTTLLVAVICALPCLRTSGGGKPRICRLSATNSKLHFGHNFTSHHIIRLDVFQVERPQLPLKWPVMQRTTAGSLRDPSPATSCAIQMPWLLLYGTTCIWYASALSQTPLCGILPIPGDRKRAMFLSLTRCALHE